MRRPPPVTRNRKDRSLMNSWLNRELDKIGDFLIATMNSDMAARDRTKNEFLDWLGSDRRLIAEAEHGNLGPLQKKYPQLAKFLQPPKQPGKGMRLPKKNSLDAARLDSEIWALTLAVWDAARIRTILRLNYKQKLEGYDSPEETASNRWEVDLEQVHSWKRSKRCPKNPHLNIETSFLRVRAALK
jgi:hypothetical protein